MLLIFPALAWESKSAARRQDIKRLYKSLPLAAALAEGRRLFATEKAGQPLDDDDQKLAWSSEIKMTAITLLNPGYKRPPPYHF